MAYNYVATSQKPTAVKSAIVCSFTGTDEQNLVMARGNRLEFHSLTSDGLVPIFDVGIYGNILTLASFRPPTLAQDVIFVLSERKQFSILSYNKDTNKIVTRASGNLRDKVGRDLDSGPLGLIDPENRVIAVFLYEGLVKVN